MKRAPLFLMLFVTSLQLWCQIPQMISYQGILTGPDGKIVADNLYSITFKLYDVKKGGESLWVEKQEVVLTDGLFHVRLGSVNPLNLPFDRPYWLSISLENDKEMMGRLALNSSPYSLNARSVVDSLIDGKKIASGQLIRSINSLTDHIELEAGENVSISQEGQKLRISAILERDEDDKPISDKEPSLGKAANTFLFKAENMASGIYYYQIQAGGFVQSKKLLLTKMFP